MAYELIYGFENEHPVGIVCRAPCKYCGETATDIGWMSGSEAKCLAPVPMLILRRATREEYVEFVIQNSGAPPHEPLMGFFYAVSMD